MDPKFLAKSAFFHQASGTYYSMSSKDRRLWQTRWQLGPQGEPQNQETLEVDEVMGSGNHARTYLHREGDGRLIELPLAWYAEDGGHFGMNPGFDNAHPATRRAISYECMSCHNGYPRTPDLTHADFAARPIYVGELPQGIDCQRCHGPGQRHVTAAESANQPIDAVRAAILNPARIDAARQMQVCELCHLQTTSQPLPDHIRHYDRPSFSYEAGQPLEQSISYFMRDSDQVPPDNFEIVSAPYRLRQSRCFRESKGSLTCETCHNPHNLQKGPAATEYYANICLRCHSSALAAEVASGQHVASHVCVSCHMPVRRTEDVVHVLMTDHLIQRRPPPAEILRRPMAEVEAVASRSYRGPVKPYPGVAAASAGPASLYTAVAQVQEGSNLRAGIPQLQAAITAEHPVQAGFSVELGDAEHRVGNQPAAMDAYRNALLLDPLSVRARRGLAVAQADAGQGTEAISTLGEALAHDSSNPVLLYERGRVELQAGQQSSGMEDLRKAIQLQPDFALAQNELGLGLAAAGQTADAENAFRASLKTDPYDAGAEANLANLLADRQDWKEAAFYLDKAVHLAPQSVAYRSRLVSVLTQLQQWKRAEAEARAIVALSPRSCTAELQLGEVLGASGAVAAAELEFQKCLAISETDGRAHLDLAMARLQRGDRQAALQDLNVAVRDQDQSVSDRAKMLLSQVGVR